MGSSGHLAGRPLSVYARAIPDAGLALLRAAPEIGVLETRDDGYPWTVVALHEAVRDRDGILVLLTDRVDAALLDAAGPRLRVVANLAIGVNNVDVAACTARGVLVTNTPGVLTEATADLTFALLLASARRLGEGERLVRAGGWRGFSPLLLLGAPVHGRTLGIVGAGRIGTAVARRARGFDMRVLFTAPGPRPELEALGARASSLEELLRESDFVSLHVPLTPATHHLLDARALASMKPTAHLINTARGPIVDEAALVAALRQGVIAGAALDVFAAEPALAPGLGDLPNVVLAPHVGSATREARDRMAVLAAEGLLAGLRGQRPAHLVNPEAWEAARRRSS